MFLYTLSTSSLYKADTDRIQKDNFVSMEHFWKYEEMYATNMCDRMGQI